MSNSGFYSLIDEDIYAINMWDNGFVVIRDGHAIFQFPVQMYKKKIKWIKTYNMQKTTYKRRKTHKNVIKDT